MLATRIIGWLSFVFIIGFLVFGLRQGFRAKAAAGKNRGSSAGSPGSDSSGDSGHLP
jgi:hypothetical protein